MNQGQRLRILSLEDDPQDAQLIQDLFETENIACEITRVDAESGFVESLNKAALDLILADYTLPSFDGISALKLATALRPEVPFIFFSGTLGEEFAVEALKIGATDYVLKTRQFRLVPAAMRALREAKEKHERKQAQEKLRRSETYLAEAQKLSHTGSFGWDVSTGEIYWSRETFRIFEVDPMEKVTIDFIVQRTHPEDRATVRQSFTLLSQERREFEHEHRLLMTDGSVKYVLVVGRPSENEAGHHEYVGAVTDITERKRAESDLRRSEGYLAEAQRLTHSGSWAWDVRTQEAFWSQEMFRLLGYDSEVTKPTLSHFMARIHPEDRALVEQTVREESSGADLDFVSDYRIVLPDGIIKHIHAIAHPILDDAGEITSVVGTSMDVTERKKAEEELRQSEARLLEAQRVSHTGNWIHDVESGTVSVSPEVHRIFGVEPGEDASNPALYFSRIHPDDRQRTQALFEKCEREKIDYQTDYRIVLPDGAIMHQRAMGRPVLNASGDVVQFVGIVVDDTEEWEARILLEKAFDEIKRLKDRLHDENIALREEIYRSLMFEEIVGESPALKTVLAQVVKVAPTDSTVLITGETGTGKELIARAIHKRSQRLTRPFVSVSCAAIPHSLIGSELFGHEKGAFTGASQRRLGRFELAEGGTIFLDEIGELPLDTQVALLRVLQEREFERLGGAKTVRTNVRVIAATNRDLLAAIEAGTFRSDLYYRLNVFPIHMPPLRKRKDDIRLLVEQFVDRYARKAGKKIRGISQATLERLTAYNWPGNVRELQNMIERSVIVCDSENLTVDASWFSGDSKEAADFDIPLLRMPASEEKKAIEKALADTQGRISGPDGAAIRLGVPASTLDSKIKAHKINKYRFKTAAQS